MYKIYNAFICGKEFCCSKKPLLIMKLTMVLLTMAFLQASAKSSGVVGTATEVVQKTVTGKVVDEKGQPMPGVVVKQKDKPQVAVTTGADGSYKITIADDNATLVYSFMQYDTHEESARGRTVINVSMTPQQNNLEEVVVVGYGSQKRTSLTDAVGTINAAEIKRNSVTDLTNAIVGRTPGVRVTTQDANPGLYHTDIDIRGFTGASGGQQTPLFVIDGVPRDKASFDHLDPNEIESFSVLKDAAAAIYGVEAANGVILVTTRKGEVGKIQTSYTGQAGVVLILRYPDLMNAYEEESTADENMFNNQESNRADPITPKYSYQNIQDAYNNKIPTYDWIRAVIGTRSNQSQHNLNVTGGSEQVRFFTSGGYIHEGGLLTSGIEYSDKYNGRTSVTAQMSKSMTLDINIGFIDEIYHRPNQQGDGARYYNLTRNLWAFIPQDSFYLFDNPAHYNQPVDNPNDNPIASITRSGNGYDDNDGKQFTSIAYLTWQVPYIKGLTAKLQVDWDNNNTMDKQQVKAFTQWSYDYTNNVFVQNVHHNPTTLSQSYTQSIRDDIQAQLNYQTHFGKNNFAALGLFETTYNEKDNTNAASQFAVDALALLDAGLSVGQTAAGGKSINSQESFVGRLNYDYAGRYLLEGGFRYEGSSYFPPAGRWGFFPYVSGGWRISEEPFIKNNFKWIDNIKLRGSYGRLGDDQDAAGSFPAFTTGFTYPSSNSLYSGAAGRNGGDQVGTIFGSTGGITKGVDYKSIANPNITWSVSTTADIGLETAFWHSLLTAEFDVFDRERSGLLANQIVAIPGNFGGTLPKVNLNSDRTRGFEITLGHRDVAGEFNYGISANMSFSRSNWKHNEESPQTNPTNVWTGQKSNRFVDFIRGRPTAGQFQSYADIYSYPTIIDGNGNRSLLPGDIKYVDANGDGVSNGSDNIVLANGGLKPLVYFGTTLDANWRGFDFTMLIQGATMYHVSYTDGLAVPFIRDPQDPITTYVDRWHHADLFNLSSPWVPGKWPSTGGNVGGANNQRQNNLGSPSQFNTFDATYARIKQIQLGYTFPKKMLSKINISKLRLFVSAYDLFTWQPKGLNFVDPEYTQNNPQTGSNYNAPMVMNITAGAQLTF